MHTTKKLREQKLVLDEYGRIISHGRPMSLLNSESSKQYQNKQHSTLEHAVEVQEERANKNKEVIQDITSSTKELFSNKPDSVIKLPSLPPRVITSLEHNQYSDDMKKNASPATNSPAQKDVPGLVIRNHQLTRSNYVPSSNNLIRSGNVPRPSSRKLSKSKYIIPRSKYVPRSNHFNRNISVPQSKYIPRSKYVPRNNHFNRNISVPQSNYSSRSRYLSSRGKVSRRKTVAKKSKLENILRRIMMLQKEFVDEDKIAEDVLQMAEKLCTNDTCLEHGNPFCFYESFLVLQKSSNSTHKTMKKCMCSLQNTSKNESVGLVSLPGSGNTWVRGLLERATHICTGSLWCDANLRFSEFCGEGVRSSDALVIKNHDSTIRWRGQQLPLHTSSHGKPEFDAVIFIHRNPFDSIVAEHNRKLALMFWQKELESYNHSEEFSNYHTRFFGEDYFGEFCIFALGVIYLLYFCR